MDNLSTLRVGDTDSDTKQPTSDPASALEHQQQLALCHKLPKREDEEHILGTCPIPEAHRCSRHHDENGFENVDASLLAPTAKTPLHRPILPRTPIAASAQWQNKQPQTFFWRVPLAKPLQASTVHNAALPPAPLGLRSLAQIARRERERAERVQPAGSPPVWNTPPTPAVAPQFINRRSIAQRARRERERAQRMANAANIAQCPTPNGQSINRRSLAKRARREREREEARRARAECMANARQGALELEATAPEGLALPNRRSLAQRARRERERLQRMVAKSMNTPSTMTPNTSDKSMQRSSLLNSTTGTEPGPSSMDTKPNTRSDTCQTRPPSLGPSARQKLDDACLIG
ncbi:hypothetical protein CCMSSC00406_0002487 [Pleurotus cornucopiae]|uniref:Uncharacterized protein n=1 Tax=Pleurotus cornucopiae TaxID=5321 RepID=A0ACB7IRQ4_PLECO|nr:hypothetical protein CCMSSC00406_0002487 [Pleurotus cornucopiae]